MDMHYVFAIILVSAFIFVAPAMSAPMTLDQLLTSLKLDKAPIQFKDPNDTDQDSSQPEKPDIEPVPADFAGGKLNNKGGSLMVLEGIKVPTDLSTLKENQVSDILVFPPNGKQILLFSDPFPAMFPIPTFDAEGKMTGTENMSFSALLSTANFRRVAGIQEGFLIDQRTGGKAPFGNDPVDINRMFKVDNVTIFVNKFSSTDSQAYVILSDNPVPEPASSALYGIGLLGLGLAVRRRYRVARPIEPASGL